MNETQSPWWRSPSKLPFAVFVLIAAYFLWTEHRAHVIEFLPWLLILGCIVMHLFMHGAHGRRHKGAVDEPRDEHSEQDR